MKDFCYAGGKIVNIKKATVPANDIGLLRGFGVFDFLRTYNGKPFHFKDHFTRFKGSAKILGLKVPKTEAEVLNIIQALLKKNKCQDASIRLVLTGGPTENGVDFKDPTFYILMESLYEFSPEVFQKGGKLITHEYERVFPSSKNTNYLTAVSLQKLKKQKKAIEILYIKNGKVLEASTSNIFVFLGNKLVTPSDGVLHGITRKLVIKLASKNLSVIERDITVKEIFQSSEVFITATNKKITPIVNIDGKKVGSGKVGDRTKILMKALDDYIKNY